MFNSDETQGTLYGAGSGAASGAGIGAAFGPGGALIGGGAGAVLGGITGYFRGSGTSKVKKAMAQSRAEMAALAQSQRAQRESDLSRALAYFKPAQDVMARSWQDYNTMPGAVDSSANRRVPGGPVGG